TRGPLPLLQPRAVAKTVQHDIPQGVDIDGQDDTPGTLIYSRVACVPRNPSRRPDMAEQYREEREPTEAPQPEARTEDPATMVKTETPTSHGMMWAISSPTGGVLALVRDEA